MEFEARVMSLEMSLALNLFYNCSFILFIYAFCDYGVTSKSYRSTDVRHDTNFK